MGLAVGADGVLSGTPTLPTGPHGEPQPGVITVHDLVGASALRNVSFGVTPAPLAISTSLPDGQMGVIYRELLQTTGGFGASTFTVGAGTLPTGLSLEPGTTVNPGTKLAGTPTTPGTFDFTLSATNYDQVASRDYHLVITSNLSVITSGLPAGQVGVPYSVSLVAQGGVAPYVWDLSAGTSPPGLSLAASGMLEGTPTIAGNYQFTARATDAAAQWATSALTLVVDP
jgi:hypothetical protein